MLQYKKKMNETGVKEKDVDEKDTTGSCMFMVLLQIIVGNKISSKTLQ